MSVCGFVQAGTKTTKWKPKRTTENTRLSQNKKRSDQKRMNMRTVTNERREKGREVQYVDIYICSGMIRSRIVQQLATLLRDLTVMLHGQLRNAARDTATGSALNLSLEPHPIHYQILIPPLPILPYHSIMLPSDDSSPPPPASTAPLSAPPQSGFSKLNDFLHRDYVTDVAFYGFWLGFWLIMPPYIFLGTLALAAYDLVSMRGYRKPCGPVLITGCDMGFGKDLALALAAQGWKVRVLEGGQSRRGWDIVTCTYCSPFLRLHSLLLTSIPYSLRSLRPAAPRQAWRYTMRRPTARAAATSPPSSWT